MKRFYLALIILNCIQQLIAVFESDYDKATYYLLMVIILSISATLSQSRK